MHNGLLGHSNNLENTYEELYLQFIFTSYIYNIYIYSLTKYLTDEIVQIFSLHLFFLLRGEGEAATPWDAVSYAYDNFHKSMLD